MSGQHAYLALVVVGFSSFMMVLALGAAYTWMAPKTAK